MNPRKNLEILALNNAIIDVIFSVTDEEFEKWGMRKGDWNPKSRVKYAEFLDDTKDRDKIMMAGGSPGNVAFGTAALGISTGLLGSVGNDELGKRYILEAVSCGMTSLMDVKEGKSGVCHILITPDKERSMVTDMGVSTEFDYDLSGIHCELFHSSAYELASKPGYFMDLWRNLKSDGSKMSFDLAGASIVRKHQADIDEIVHTCDILFATTEEAIGFTGYEDERAHLDTLGSSCETLVYKKGKDGSIVKRGREEHVIDVYPAKVINTNGAGDAYAAGFLTGYLRDFSLEESGHLGSFIASRVVGNEGNHYSKKM